MIISSKIKIFSLSLTFILLNLTICCSRYSKDSYLKDFENFIAEVEENHVNYTDDDWTKKNQEYQTFINDYYAKFETEFTSEDQKVIGNLKSKYQIIRIKTKTKKLIDQTSDGINQLEGAIEGVIQEINK